LLLENVFYATDGGIAINSTILGLLKDAQRNRDVNAYAIFGRRADGSADGRVGNWLQLDDEIARDLVSAIKREAKRLPRGPFDETAQGGRCGIRKPSGCVPPIRHRRRSDKVCG